MSVSQQIFDVDQIKSIDIRCRNIVFGFIRQYESLYIIPDLITHIILIK